MIEIKYIYVNSYIIRFKKIENLYILSIPLVDNKDYI